MALIVVLEMAPPTDEHPVQVFGPDADDESAGTSLRKLECSRRSRSAQSLRKTLKGEVAHLKY